MVRSLVQVFRNHYGQAAPFDNFKVLVSQTELQVFPPGCIGSVVKSVDAVYEGLTECSWQQIERDLGRSAIIGREECQRSLARSIDTLMKSNFSVYCAAQEKLNECLEVAATEMQDLILPCARDAYGGDSNLIQTGVQAMAGLMSTHLDTGQTSVFYPPGTMQDSVFRGLQFTWSDLIERISPPPHWEEFRNRCILSLATKLAPRTQGTRPVIGPILTSSLRFSAIYRNYVPVVKELCASSSCDGQIVSIAKKLLGVATTMSEPTRNWIVHEKFEQRRKLVCIAICSMSLSRLLTGEIEALSRRCRKDNWSVIIVHRDADSVAKPDGMRLLRSRSEPFEYLFPFCDVVVTHGGTTRYQAVASLAPMVLVSYGIADQKDVGKDLEQLGLGKCLSETCSLAQNNGGGISD